MPIVATTDKGQNYITVTINSDNDVPEITTANNSVTVPIFIYQDELTPIYPYNYAIITYACSKTICIHRQSIRAYYAIYDANGYDRSLQFTQDGIKKYQRQLVVYLNLIPVLDMRTAQYITGELPLYLLKTRLITGMNFHSSISIH